MATTSRDWRVTASREADRSAREFTAAHTEELEPLEVLARYLVAYDAAGAALGAMIEAELRAGATWPEVATALGFPDEASARQILGRALEHGARRLHERLPDA